MASLTIAYITGRQKPRWEWFIDSFLQQVQERERSHPDFDRRTVKVILIDACLWSGSLRYFARSACTGQLGLAHGIFHDEARRQELQYLIRGRFDYQHLPPKPCIWQGPFRFTKDEFFAASNARNTAMLACQTDYLACVDDLSVLMPGWLTQVMHASEHGYCVCGSYKKVKKLEVEFGLLKSCEEYPAGVDSRWPRGSDGGIVPWSGAGLFGCSFGMPLEYALKVDGFEPAANGMGAEDYDYGIRLERAGCPIFYNRNMLTLESEEAHFEEKPLRRESRMVTKDRLPDDYNGNRMSDHVLLNRVRGETSRILPLFPENLRAARDRFLSTGMVEIPEGPTTDWKDGTPLKDL